MTESADEPICIVRGSINHDEYFHVDHVVRPGETLWSTGHESRVGGKGANQAVAVARAGGRVRFYGAVGADGAWIRERMEGYGVCVGDICVVEEPTGRAIIQVDKQGENSIVLFPGANRSERPEHAFAEGGFPLAACVLLQNEIHPGSTRYALEHARGAQVVFNPSPLPAPDELRAFPWGSVAWLVVNAAEARGVLDALGGADEVLPMVAEPREVLARLSALPALRATGVVCTLGAGGVLAAVRGQDVERARGEVQVRAAALRGEVRDTTGAGDCFTGYFAQGLMERKGEMDPGEMTKVLRTCVVAAGMCCEKRGTIDSIPMRAQVEERLASL